MNNTNNKKPMDSIYNKKFTNINNKNLSDKRGRPTSTENFKSKLKLIYYI